MQKMDNQIIRDKYREKVATKKEGDESSEQIKK